MLPVYELQPGPSYATLIRNRILSANKYKKLCVFESL
jgi:hypothetical protein